MYETEDLGTATTKAEKRIEGFTSYFASNENLHVQSQNGLSKKGP